MQRKRHAQHLFSHLKIVEDRFTNVPACMCHSMEFSHVSACPCIVAIGDFMQFRPLGALRILSLLDYHLLTSQDFFYFERGFLAIFHTGWSRPQPAVDPSASCTTIVQMNQRTPVLLPFMPFMPTRRRQGKYWTIII